MAQPVEPSVPDVLDGPLDVTTTAQTVHTGEARDAIVLTLNNYTASDVDVTVTIAGTPLVFTVPAKSLETVGPFGTTGEVQVEAASNSAVYALISVYRYIAGA